MLAISCYVDLGGIELAPRQCPDNFCGLTVDSPGIEPGPHPCEGCVMPFYYEPTKVIVDPRFLKNFEMFLLIFQ